MNNKEFTQRRRQNKQLQRENKVTHFALKIVIQFTLHFLLYLRGNSHDIVLQTTQNDTTLFVLFVSQRRCITKIQIVSQRWVLTQPTFPLKSVYSATTPLPLASLSLRGKLGNLLWISLPNSQVIVSISSPYHWINNLTMTTFLQQISFLSRIMKEYKGFARANEVEKKTQKPEHRLEEVETHKIHYGSMPHREFEGDMPLTQWLKSQ